MAERRWRTPDNLREQFEKALGKSDAEDQLVGLAKVLEYGLLRFTDYEGEDRRPGLAELVALHADKLGSSDELRDAIRIRNKAGAHLRDSDFSDVTTRGAVRTLTSNCEQILRLYDSSYAGAYTSTRRYPDSEMDDEDGSSEGERYDPVPSYPTVSTSSHGNSHRLILGFVFGICGLGAAIYFLDNPAPTMSTEKPRPIPVAPASIPAQTSPIAIPADQPSRVATPRLSYSTWGLSCTETQGRLLHYLAQTFGAHHFCSPTGGILGSDEWILYGVFGGFFPDREPSKVSDFLGRLDRADVAAGFPPMTLEKTETLTVENSPVSEVFLHNSCGPRSYMLNNCRDRDGKEEVDRLIAFERADGLDFVFVIAPSNDEDWLENTVAKIKASLRVTGQ